MKEYDGFVELAGAILNLAADDYIKAIVKGNDKEIKKLERFFLSAWGQQLSLNQGEAIIWNCRRIAKEKCDTMTQNK